jgi:hypothetical protein
MLGENYFLRHGEEKQILEENYNVKRTLDYYACHVFSSRQSNHESIASWSIRTDTMQSELREAAFKICEDAKPGIDYERNSVEHSVRCAGQGSPGLHYQHEVDCITAKQRL